MRALKPLLQELKEVARSKDNNGIELIPNDSNIFLWRAVIEARRFAWLGGGR